MVIKSNTETMFMLLLYNVLLKNYFFKSVYFKCMKEGLCMCSSSDSYTVELKKGSLCLSEDLISDLYERVEQSCFQGSWNNASKKQREKLLELIRRLAEDDKEGVMAHKVIQSVRLV